jgi:folylpolyglutamate synthase/dihydropteroate synthase
MEPGTANSQRSELSSDHDLRDDALTLLYSYHAPESHRSCGLPSRCESANWFLARTASTFIRSRNRNVRITGTNGKSTAAHAIEQRLLACGQHTLTLTSPHLLSVRERIRIDGSPITWRELSRVLGTLKPHLRDMQRAGHHPSPIAVLTLAALWLLADGDADVIGVLEVGKGGGSDGINVFDGGVVVLTSFGDDHLAEFGGTHQSLLSEKLGLCRRGQPLVCGPLDDATWRAIETHCTREGIPLQGRLRTPHDSHGRPDWGSPYQNVAELSVRCLGIGTDARWTAPPGAPERHQVRTIDRRTFIVDGAHNAPAWEVLVERLNRRAPCSRAAIVGIQKSKDWRAMLATLCRADVVNCLIAVETTIGDPVPQAELCKFAASEGVATLTARGVATAVKQVIEGPWDECVVTGSFRLFRDFELALHLLGRQEVAAPRELIDPAQPWMRPLL